MSKIGLLVCGNSGIDYIDHDYDIEIIRSILFAGGSEYTDFIDITAGDFYQMLEEDKTLSPTTAQAATGVIYEQYKKMLNKGYDELLVVSISSKLSGTYSGCVTAAKMVKNAKVTVFDSLTVSYPQAYMGLTAAQMIRDGHRLEEVLKELERIRDNNKVLISVSTLRYLVKNGRLSNASGFMGSMLKIKPMIEITKDGRVESIEKIRTLKKSSDRLIEKFFEETEGKNIKAFIIAALAEDRVAYFKAAIKDRNPDLEVDVLPLTPVVGAHTGPGAIGLGYILI